MNRFFLPAAITVAVIACRPSSPPQDAPGSTCEAPQYLVPSPGAKLSRLGTDGPCIIDADGQPVVLRGFSVADPLILRGRGVDPLPIMRQAVEDFGASVIRIPVHKEGFAPNPEAYATTYLDPAVALGAELGAYVIIDLHLVTDYLPEKSYVLDSWSFLAARYGDRDHVLFEMFNEPVMPDDWQTWSQEIAIPTLEVIRKQAPETLVIVGGPYWSVHMGAAAESPLPDRRLAYTAHIYPEMTEKVWREQFEPIMAKYPVFVTEWGWDKTSIFPLRGDRENFGVPFSAWLATHNLSWTAWIFDNKWSSTMFDEQWRLLGGEDHMGEFVKDLLR